MNGQLDRFIRDLMSNTQERKILWAASSIKDEYRLDMPSGVLMISNTHIPESKIVLHFFRKLGEDQILCEAKTTEPDYSLLFALYSCVHNSFNVTIDSLLSELHQIMDK